MKDNNQQPTLFDLMDDSCFDRKPNGKTYHKETKPLSDEVRERLDHYRLSDYVLDVEQVGLEKTWDAICRYVIDRDKNRSDFLDIGRFSELYEIGLAAQDKVLKKRSGQYGTPDDVASVMSEWLMQCDGTAVCDVGCGTGKLILAYLDRIGYDAARKLIADGNLYLYDSDNVALKICRTTLAVKYGLDIADAIQDIYCDFLDKAVVLPPDCRVICNPPYAKIEAVQDYWEYTDVVRDTRELFSAFMEKIFSQARSTVIITPFSFISGVKFESLRREMCDWGSGFIVSFDNVPGNVFRGKKHGVFNTNTANSVRAAITVFRKGDEKGFRVSPLIRFKNEERNELLRCPVLEATLPQERQVVSEDNTMFKKIDRALVDVYDEWVNRSQFVLKDLVSENETVHLLDIPNTCRYFTVASSRKLSRTGSVTVYAQGDAEFDFLYCFINSSFTYWWWRIFDGGITYPIGLLKEMPVPFNLLTEDDKAFFAQTAQEMMANQDLFVVTKKNAGAAQENIKFPEAYRRRINDRILSILGFAFDEDIFERIHENRFFRNSETSNTKVKNGR